MAKHSAIVAVMLSLAAATPAFAQKGDWISLFNGTDLTGWKGHATHWSVEDGAITGRTSPETLLNYNTFLIWEGGEPGDFELRLKYKIVGGNSGVQYRSRVLDAEKFIVTGYQADIDSKPVHTGLVYEEKGRRMLAHRGQKARIAKDGTISVIGSFGDKGVLQGKIKNEDWNEYRIVARGKTLTHYINGQQMSQCIDNQNGTTVRLKQGRGAKATEVDYPVGKTGVIALQLHQGPPMTVQFKDLRLKHLPPKKKKA